MNYLIIWYLVGLIGTNLIIKWDDGKVTIGAFLCSFVLALLGPIFPFFGFIVVGLEKDWFREFFEKKLFLIPFIILSLNINTWAKSSPASRSSVSSRPSISRSNSFTKSAPKPAPPTVKSPPKVYNPPTSVSKTKISPITKVRPIQSRNTNNNSYKPYYKNNYYHSNSNSNSGLFNSNSLVLWYLLLNNNHNNTPAVQPQNKEVNKVFPTYSDNTIPNFAVDEELAEENPIIEIDEVKEKENELGWWHVLGIVICSIVIVGIISGVFVYLSKY